LLPEIAGAAMMTPQNPQLAAALDRAFAELPGQPPRRTRAIVVVKDGRLIAERYAEGIGIDTQLLGFSVTKSVISALVGVLVRQGRLKLDESAPVAAWSKRDDPRHAITIDQLLRHTSGLALGSSLKASLGSTLEPVVRMKYVENDMAAYAESVPLASQPGSSWNYQDGNTLILSRLIRDVLGGDPAEVLRFARRELFAPLGMRHVTLQLDGTGTIEGSSELLRATGRGSASSISTTAWPVADASCLWAGSRIRHRRRQMPGLATAPASGPIAARVLALPIASSMACRAKPFSPRDRSVNM